jgi:Uma2 family endonuclease
MEFALTSLPLPVRLRRDPAMTDAELMRFSRENRPLRMEREPNGEILVMTPTGFATMLENQRICHFLQAWTIEDGSGLSSGPDGGYRLPNGAVRSPDAGWFSLLKVTQMTPEQQEEGFALFAPDFVIELRSPTDRLADARSKMQEWVANGVSLAWLIDPKRRVVEVYRPGEEVEWHENPTSVLGTGCVSGLCLVMERVWGS